MIRHEGERVSPVRDQLMMGVDTPPAHSHRGAGQSDALPGFDAQKGIATEPQPLLGALQEKAAGRLA